MRAFAAAAALLAACAPPRAGRTGSSIALSGDSVAVVDPDQGGVSFLDPETLEVRRSVSVGGEPRALLPLASGALLVSNHRGGELVLLEGGVERTRRAVCAGPWGMAEAEGFVAVACEWEGTVIAVDPATLAPRTLLSGLRRPRAVAAIGAQVWAAEFTGGRVVRSDGRAFPLVPIAAPERPALAAMTASLAGALWPEGETIFAAHLLVNNDGAALEKTAADYGSVADANPKINPTLTDVGSGRSVAYAAFDGGARVFNGPSAVASDGEGRLLVAHLGTANVAVLEGAAVIGSFEVGAGPRGIAVDARRRVAYVDNAHDASVSRVDLTRYGPRQPAGLTRARSLPSPFSAAALEGRRLFHDAKNPHLTPAGVVSCATCHPEGGDDGLVWFIHTDRIPLKRRRTPHLGNARGAPFHWDGQFATLDALVRSTITDLMAGDALLVDISAIRAYIEQIVRPPLGPRPPEAQVALGELVFGAAGCAGCHAAPGFTDNKLHSVLQPMSLTEDDRIAAARTPGLRGVFLRAPFLHDGRARDLRDASAHGGALSPADLDGLVAYLESL